MIIPVLMTWAFFGPIALEQAKDNCQPEPITKACYVEAISPIEPVSNDLFKR